MRSTVFGTSSTRTRSDHPRLSFVIGSVASRRRTRSAHSRWVGIATVCATQSTLRPKSQPLPSRPGLLFHPQFLFTHYNLGWWFYETIESYRRVFFVSVLALIPDKTLAGLIGVIMGFLSTLLFEKGQPFHVSSTNTMAAAASLALSASYASGLLLVTTNYGED